MSVFSSDWSAGDLLLLAVISLPIVVTLFAGVVFFCSSLYFFWHPRRKKGDMNGVFMLAITSFVLIFLGCLSGYVLYKGKIVSYVKQVQEAKEADMRLAEIMLRRIPLPTENQRD